LDRGDLLIANKGTRLGTYLYQGHPEKCIASSSFFVIALHNREKVHPGFLYWYLNQPPAKVYLTKNLSGSTIPSLTKAVLENMKVRVPSLELQQHIVEFVEAIEEEKKLLRSLLRNRNEYCDNYIWNLIQSAS
jgi:restriction endonuclease S subunit